MPAIKLRPASSGNRSLPKRLSLTEAMLPRLTCPQKRSRVFVYDTKVRGLAYQITANDARSWYFYGRVKGERRPVKYHLGAADTVALDRARREAMKIGTDAAHGQNPATVRRAEADKAKRSITFFELWERYRELHLKTKCSKGSLKVDISHIKHLSSLFSRRIDTIPRADVEALHEDQTANKSASIANRSVKLLKRILAYGKIDPNPARGVKLNREEPRTRFLTKDEVVRLLKSIEQCGSEVARDAMVVALLTGARKNNVCAMRWPDVHIDNGLWIIPAGLYKNRRTTTINLPSPAVEILKRRRSQMPDDAAWVFPGRFDHLRFIDDTWNNVRARAGLPDVHFHDLRHTLASWMAMGGASLQVIGKQLGHLNIQSTARYAHLELAPVRAAAHSAITAMMPPASKRKSVKRKQPRK